MRLTVGTRVSRRRARRRYSFNANEEKGCFVAQRHTRGMYLEAAKKPSRVAMVRSLSRMTKVAGEVAKTR